MGSIGDGHEGRIRALTWALAAACLTVLTWFALSRHGNLSWDDADYLWRGLADARIAATKPGFASIFPLYGRLLQERPKPPLLVGWIALGSMVLGRGNIDALMVHAAVVPFAVLIATVAALARRYRATGASLVCVIALLASPRMLTFGAKIMVETFLSLWVLLALALAAVLTVRPSRRIGMALGLAVGLALLTKATAVLLLGGAMVPFLGWFAGPGQDRRARLQAVGWAIVLCLAVAGPWYLRNGPETARFARFSSRYNIAAEGRSDVVPTSDRLLRMAADLPGWPLAALLAVMAFHGRIGRRSRAPIAPPVPDAPGPPSVWPRFQIMVLASTLAAALVLLAPPYFDTRFLLPLWPALAVALGAWLARWFASVDRKSRLAASGCLAASLSLSCITLAHEPVYATCWPAKDLIDDLVTRHGVKTLASVGNTAEWNVCKTALLNELRRDPANCYVLLDLSAESAEGLRARLPRFDAVIVLEPAAYPPGYLAQLPGLNRAQPLVHEILQDCPSLVRAEGSGTGGLPPHSVYVASPTVTR